MKKYLTLSLFLIPFLLSAQDSVPAPEREFTERTFWSNRVANQQSVETAGEGNLVFRIGHRMGRVSSGFDGFFGLDESTFRLSFDYGITDRLMVSIGRSTVQKLYDGSVKFKIMRQSSGPGAMPLTLTGYASMAVNSLKFDSHYPEKYFSSRLSYTFQLIAGRKFNDWFSLQLAPALVHRNLVKKAADRNDVVILGGGATFKMTRRLALNLEYNYILPGQIASDFNDQKVRNSATIGLDIYTGRHVFQVFVTNSTAMAEKQFLTETTEDWLHDGIRIGFNIERIFRIYQK